MKPKVYIDGQAGTTGLKIKERFALRNDIELLEIDPEKRKDTEERKKLINASDFTFLCLPDAAAVEAVSLAESENVRIIDASTAHRTAAGWDYGFPELSAKHRENIRKSHRVANPGCYASGFISLVYPLVSDGIISPDFHVTSFAVSGYSGGGNKMIAEYEGTDKTEEDYSPRFYGLGANHKHLPEMKAISGLNVTPSFTPIVDDYYSGMIVAVPLFTSDLAKKGMKAADLQEVFAKHYEGQKMVKVAPLMPLEESKTAKLAANTFSGRNDMEIQIFGNDDNILLTSRFDNLGKGASGAAVQCMNIMMGIDETTGLV